MLLLVPVAGYFGFKFAHARQAEWDAQRHRARVEAEQRAMAEREKAAANPAAVRPEEPR